MDGCGHGWLNENDCDVCRPPAIVVAGLRGRISELEAALRPFADAYRMVDGKSEWLRKNMLASMTLAGVTEEAYEQAAELISEE